MLWLPKLFGKRCICTIHGLDHKRQKWSRFAKAYIMLGEKVAAKFADEMIVLDVYKRQLLGQAGFTSLNAYALMIFCLLYSPCVATIGTIKKETNSWKFTLGMVLFQLAVAWVGAVLVYQIGSLFV